MAQAQQVTSSLSAMGIRIASVGVDPFRGGVIAWLAVEPGALGLLDASEALGVTIEEVGRVPQARVRNDGDQPVILRADSVLAGGRQTRVVERSAIVAPRSTVLVRVRCVEAHRWAPENEAARDGFTVAGMTSRRMREQLARQRDSSFRATGHHELNQNRVWREVSAELCDAAVDSRTDSYLPLVSEVRARSRARARSHGVNPPGAANAALVLPDAGAASVEVFASSAALRAHADELVADLAEVDGLRSETRGPASVSEGLARLLGAAVARVDSEADELGEPFALQSSRVCGSLLMHESRVAQLSAVIG